MVVGGNAVSRASAIARLECAPGGAYTEANAQPKGMTEALRFHPLTGLRGLARIRARESLHANAISIG